MSLWIIWVRSTIKTPTLRLKQLIGPKGSLPARPHGPKSATPPFPRNQTKLPDRPGADIGRGAACEPLTARTGLEPSKAREKGTLPGSAECILGRPLKGCILVINTSRIAEVSLAVFGFIRLHRGESSDLQAGIYLARTDHRAAGAAGLLPVEALAGHAIRQAIGGPGFSAAR